MENNYLILDMGTGNSRVGLVSSDGVVLGIRSYVNRYHTDPLYEDAQYFHPRGSRQMCMHAHLARCSRKSMAFW